MTKVAAVQVSLNGDATSLKAAIAEAVGVVGRFKKAAEDSASVFEKAFASNERAVDKLRRAIDPAYASAKQFEGAVKTLDAALKSGTITQAEYGRMIEQAQAKFQNFAKVQDQVAKSAQESAAVFKAEAAALEGLRAAIDPVFAASKRYEAAVEQLDAALRAGMVTEQQHALMVSKAGAAYLGTQQAVTRHTGALSVLSNMSNSTKGKIQNLGYQVQDMAIQFQMGTNAATIFAQQGSQVASIFGPVGAIIGTLAAVGIPLLAAAFATGGEKAATFGETIDRLQESISRLNEITKTYSADGLEQMRLKYGEITQEVLSLIEAQRQQALAEAVTAATAAVSALRDEYRVVGIEAGTTGRQAEQAFTIMANRLEITKDQARALSAAYYDLKNADSFAEQASALTRVRTLLEESNLKGTEFYGTVLDAEDAMRQLAEAAPNSGWLFGAITEAKELATALWDAVAAKAAATAEGNVDAAGNNTNYGPGSRARSAPRRAPVEGAVAATGKVSGGGGGAKTNPLVAQLEQLQQSLLTQEEAQIASYARQQETLRLALEQRLLTQQEYAALMQDSQQKHQDTMAQIDAYRYGTGLQQTAQFMGDMANVLASGGEKMVRISRIFGAAQALINTYVGASEALKLPFPSNLAAAAKIIGAGMGFVSAIKSGSTSSSKGSGGIGSTAAAEAAAPAAPTRTANFSIQGDVIGKATGGELIREINKAIKDGYQINMEWV